MTDAALGTTATVASLTGDLELEVPPGTQPGEVRVLAGEGMPSLRGARRGSLYVRLDVAVPTSLDSEQRRLARGRRPHARPGRLRGEARRGRGLLPPPEERAALSGIRRVALRVPDGEVEVATAWLLDRFPDGLEERDLGGSSELAVFTDDAGDVSRPSGVRGRDVRARAVRLGGSLEGVPSSRSCRWPLGRAAMDRHRPPTRARWSSIPGGRSERARIRRRERASSCSPASKRGSLLDAGCGSGVVAVAAARLGFAPVVAVDLDEVAVQVAAVTARANDVEIDVHRADVLDDELPRTDVLAANIELRVVEQLLARARSTVAVTSGYLAAEAPLALGWADVDRLELEGWAADVFVKPH